MCTGAPSSTQAGCDSLPAHGLHLPRLPGITIMLTFPLMQLSRDLFIHIPSRTSECVEELWVNPITGVVQCAFAKGNVYEYTHVSRRAILNLLSQPQMSLGFWVNRNLLAYDCKSKKYGYSYTLPVILATSMPYLS